MRRITQFLTGAAVAGGIGLLGVPAAHAGAPCDAYSGKCPPVHGDVVKKEAPKQQVSVVRAKSSPSTLPFTGGDVVLLSLAGSAAVAGGAAIVVAARRRPDAA